MPLPGFEGDSVSVSGLTSRSGRTGLGGRAILEDSVRLFQGVEDLARKYGRLESGRGTGVRLADPG